MIKRKIEMDNILEKLSNDWENINKVIIFGWGKYGQKLIHSILRDFEVLAIIDNDLQKNGMVYNGIPVMSLELADKLITDYKIIVTTYNEAYEDISKMLSKIGLREYYDYCKIEHFVVEWYWRFRKKINIFELHTSVTTRCTLKCLKCNMFMPYYDAPKDISCEQLMDEFDVLFKHIDYIYNYELLGGEAFLNKDLNRILSYLLENYGNRIGQVGIITNGTIIPDEKTWELLKKYAIHLSVSDYTSTVPYTERLEQFILCAKEKGIKYKVLRSLQWKDFGFPEHPCSYNNVRQHMLCCGPVFHGYNDGKLYYCHVSWGAEQCGLIKLEQDDYIDLKIIGSDDFSKRQQLAKYSLGEWDKGYVSMCELCAGCGKDNNNIISAGIQK